jgi:hypothetical protein
MSLNQRVQGSSPCAPTIERFDKSEIFLDGNSAELTANYSEDP